MNSFGSILKRIMFVTLGELPVPFNITALWRNCVYCYLLVDMPLPHILLLMHLKTHEVPWGSAHLGIFNVVTIWTSCLNACLWWVSSETNAVPQSLFNFNNSCILILTVFATGPNIPRRWKIWTHDPLDDDSCDFYCSKALISVGILINSNCFDSLPCKMTEIETHILVVFWKSASSDGWLAHHLLILNLASPNRSLNWLWRLVRHYLR